jgi:carbonic anhydrase
MADTQTLTPREAFEMLLDGNQRFVADAPQHPNQDAARRSEVVPAQNPFAVLFGCSDSRPRAAGRTEDADFIAEHIRHTVELLLDRSRVLAQAVEAGQAAVVGLSYRLADGTARLVTTRGLEAPAHAVS